MSIIGLSIELLQSGYRNMTNWCVR